MLDARSVGKGLKSVAQVEELCSCHRLCKLCSRERVFTDGEGLTEATKQRTCQKAFVLRRGRKPCEHE